MSDETYEHGAGARMVYHAMTDRELLLVMAERTERADRLLFGNGRPGLVERVTSNEVKHAAIEQRSLTRVERMSFPWVLLTALIAIIPATIAAIGGLRTVVER